MGEVRSGDVAWATVASCVKKINEVTLLVQISYLRFGAAESFLTAVKIFVLSPSSS